MIAEDKIKMTILESPKEDLNENEKIVLDFFSVYANRNYEKVHQLMSENYKEHGSTKDNESAYAKNPEEAIKILKSVEDIFPDISVTMLDIFSQDDKVVVRVSFSGTHSATCFGAPASHKKIAWEALEIFRIQNAQIVESWGYWPAHEMLNQMR